MAESMSRSLGFPVLLLHEAAGHVVTVELKNGVLFRGNMIECEDIWNCQLEGISYTAMGRGIRPDKFIFPSVLKACAELGYLQQGREVLRLVRDRGIESDPFVVSALVFMHGKCGSLENAREVFDRMSHRNAVTWSAMLAGCVQSGDGEEVIKLSCRMHDEAYAQNAHGEGALQSINEMIASGVKPNSVTIASALPACVDIVALSRGREMHGYMIRSQIVSVVVAASALADSFSFAGFLPWGIGPARVLWTQGSSLFPWFFLGPLNLLELNTGLFVACRSGSDPKAYGLHSVMGFGVNKSKPFQKNPEQERLHIFIKTLTGKTICKKIWTGLLIKNLKEEIQVDSGIPPNLLCLVHEGKMLQDNLTLQHYGIGRDTTIFLSTRLRGGSTDAGPKGFQGSTSKPTGSYRDAAKGKSSPKGKEPAILNTSPGQYIVDQTPETPSISLDFPEVKGIYSDLENKAVICRFNGFWPKTEALYQWIHTVWTKDCQIHLCSKGFFIVTFLEIEERDNILNEGPWFWGSAGLFVTPWFSDFDANTMVVSRMPVWVRLHNLPLHFWHFKSLSAIGNSLGRMLKIDTDRHLKGIFTFARICVEVDLSKGLPESIFLTFNNIQWKQPLDYENTAFRCRGCQQTGHLLKACPSKSKPQQRKSRGWQNLNEVLERRTATKKAPSGTEEAEIEAEEDDTTIEEVEIETQKEDSTVNKESMPHSNQVETQQDKAEMATGDQIIGGNKRQHHSDSSDSDKESGKLKESSQLVIVSSEPPLGEWRKVEKKKGRKT